MGSMTKKKIMALFGGMLVIVFILSGCSGEQPSRSKKSSKKQKKKVVEQVVQPSRADELTDDMSDQQGYVYERKNRRDPFVPLILPTTMKVKKKGAKAGTLEGYDLSEFALAAIAKKGTQYYALLVAPDNRSFTVYEGVTIGLNKGKVKEVSSHKIIFVEYIRDVKGGLKPREIILELNKGEGE